MYFLLKCPENVFFNEKPIFDSFRTNLLPITLLLLLTFDVTFNMIAGQ